MKVADYELLDIGPVPREIRRMRREIHDFHVRLGQPIIFKHRWNLDDVNNGLAQLCPNHDLAYNRDKTDCPYCFGTGFLGGFADGVILFVTIADTPVDQLKIGPQGYIMFDKHPQLTAPWYPTMGDGDLLITANFDRATWEILSTGERFELNEVAPVTIRGFWGAWDDHNLHKVQQTAEVDRVANNHVYYNVPAVFDYSNVANIYPPFGGDPDDFPAQAASNSVGFRMIGGGDGIFMASASTPLFIYGGGTNSQETLGLRVRAKDSGTTVSFGGNTEEVVVTLGIMA